MEEPRKIPLTAVQQKVYELDLAGNTPSKIAEATGLSLSRVSNVRKRLQDLGYNVLVWRQKKVEQSDLRPANDNAVPEPIADDKSDRVWDTAGDYPVRKFCKCGLTMPCNQCLDEIELGSSSQPKDAGARNLGPIGTGGFMSGRKMKSKGCD